MEYIIAGGVVLWLFGVTTGLGIAIYAIDRSVQQMRERERLVDDVARKVLGIPN